MRLNIESLSNLKGNRIASLAVEQTEVWTLNTTRAVEQTEVWTLNTTRAVEQTGVFYLKV